MIFKETKVFSRHGDKHLGEKENHALQNALVKNPELGDKMPGMGGMRKLRWKRPGKGKRGGLRVIYYYVAATDMCLMLLVYPKSDQDDLSPEQRKILKKLVETELQSQTY